MNRIKIDPERVISDIDRNIFGGYMEIGYRDTKFSYLNVDDKTFVQNGDLRSDVKDAVTLMRLPNIRFPGGNFASGYHWRDGVGPVEERPARHDLAWNCLVSNEYGTNEFIKLCRKMNITPYLNANCGDGDMREAADWVEYCNGTGNSASANLRRSHGFEAPHNVKYWGIGNEVDGPWQIGFKTPVEYARALTEIAKVMKWTDPTIKLIASGVSLWEDHPIHLPTPEKGNWLERTQLILEQAGNYIDFLSIHRYAHPNEDDPFETYMAFAQEYEQRLHAYEGLIDAASLAGSLKHNVGIAVDEWGIIRLSTNREIWRHINLTDALVTGLHLNAFIRHARSVRLANFPRMPTSIGINISQPGGKVMLQTNFYAFELFSRTCGQESVDVYWSGETFSGKYLNHEYNGVRALDVTATLDKQKKQLMVYVVNQSKDKALETTISLTSGVFNGNVTASVVNGPDVKSENTAENPHQVGLRETVVKADGKAFVYTFEPHSITALMCEIK